MKSDIVTQWCKSHPAKVNQRAGSDIQGIQILIYQSSAGTDPPEQVFRVGKRGL